MLLRCPLLPKPGSGQTALRPAGRPLLTGDPDPHSLGSMATKAAGVNGNHLLYHYLQKDLQERNPALFSALFADAVIRLGVWCSPAIYARLPVLVPYARRDPTCRGNKKKGIPDEWGAPDSAGYFRDDNSLIKRAPAALTIRGPSKLLTGRRIGTGWVAAHVWRILNSGEFAARDPRTYSFVPNIVWLPAQLAKLTDIEGSVAQTAIQRIAWRAFRYATVDEAQRERCEAAWALIPEPSGLEPDAIVPELHYFEPTDTFFVTRAKKAALVADAMLLGGSAKTISTRYGAGIPGLDERVREERAAEMSVYASSVLAAKG